MQIELRLIDKKVFSFTIFLSYSRSINTFLPTTKYTFVVLHKTIYLKEIFFSSILNQRHLVVRFGNPIFFQTLIWKQKRGKFYWQAKYKVNKGKSEIVIQGSFAVENPFEFQFDCFIFRICLFIFLFIYFWVLISYWNVSNTNTDKWQLYKFRLLK